MWHLIAFSRFGVISSCWTASSTKNSVAAGCGSGIGTVTCCNESNNSCSDWLRAKTYTVVLCGYFGWVRFGSWVLLMKNREGKTNIFATICSELHQPTFFTFTDKDIYALLCGEICRAQMSLSWLQSGFLNKTVVYSINVHFSCEFSATRKNLKKSVHDKKRTSWISGIYSPCCNSAQNFWLLIFFHFKLNAW